MLPKTSSKNKLNIGAAHKKTKSSEFDSHDSKVNDDININNNISFKSGKDDTNNNKVTPKQRNISSNSNSIYAVNRQYIKSLISGCNKLEEFYRIKIIKYKHFLLQNLQIYIDEIRRENIIYEKSNEDFALRLHDILEIDARRLFTNCLINAIQNKITKSFYYFFQNLLVCDKNNIIIKRKKFIYGHKLLVLRNIIQEASKSFNIIKKIYFYKWYRLRNNKYKEIGIKEKLKKILKMSNKDKGKLVKNLCFIFFHILDQRRLMYRNIPDIQQYALLSETRLNIFTCSIVNILKSIFTRSLSYSYKEVRTYSVSKNNQSISANIQDIVPLVLNKLYLRKSINEDMLLSIKNEGNFNYINNEKILNYNPKKLLNFLKGFINLNRVNSINLILQKSFRTWVFKNKQIRNDGIFDKVKIQKLTLFSEIFKKQMSINYNLFLEKLHNFSMTHSDKELLQHHIISIENNYNHNLLDKIRGYYKLHTVIKSKKRFIVDLSKQNELVDFMKSKCLNYFRIWKYKCIKINKELEKVRNVYNHLPNLIAVLNTSIERVKYISFTNIKERIENISRRNKKIIPFTSKIKSIFTQNSVVYNYKTSFFNKIKYDYYYDNCYTRLLNDNRCTLMKNILQPIQIKFSKHHFDHFLNSMKEKNTFKILGKIINFNTILMKFFNPYYISVFKTLKILKLKKKKKKANTNIDHMIVKNITEVNLHFHKEIIKKTKNVKIIKALKNIFVSKIRQSSNDIIYYKNLYFEIWRNNIITEKKVLLDDLKSYIEINDEIKNKIVEYNDASNSLGDRIIEITGKAEECNTCICMLDDDLGNTFTSIKDDVFSKINPIPCIQIKSFMSRDSKKEGEVELYKSMNPEQIERMISKHNSIISKNKEEEDMFMLDDLGGLEYYNYLENKFLELQNKISKTNQDYTNKTKDLMNDIDVLWKEIDNSTNK